MSLKICLLTDIYQNSISHDKFIEEINFDKNIIKERLNVDIYLWGPGIGEEPIDWSTKIENKIEKTFGDKYFFDIILQLPGGGILDTSYYTNNKDSKTLVMIHFLEVPNNLDIDIINRVNPNIIFYMQNENALNLFYSNKYKDKIIASVGMYHSENLASEFYNEKKLIDILICGNLNEKLYPMRHRVKNLMNHNKLKNYNIVVRPNTSFKKYSVQDVINSNGEIYNESLKQTRDYIKQINQSKLVLCTTHLKDINIYGVKYSSIKHRKYVEMGLSSALRIGNKSDENFFELNNTVIDISNDDDDAAVDKLIYYLENEDERNKIVKMQNEVEKEYTCTKYIEKIIYCLKMHRSKKYGFYSFNNFSFIY
jgi:hypothetical protein